MVSVRRFLPWLAVMAVGCSSSDGSSIPSYGGEDGLAIAKLVESLTDDSRIQQRFAPGAKITVKEQRKLRGNYLEVVGSPTVAGDSATAKVRLANGKPGEESPEFEWTFAKVGDQWKIQSAPLQ